MKTHAFVLAATLLGIGAAPAGAQTFDLGGIVSSTKTTDDGRRYVSGGPVFTVHFTDHHAFQVQTQISADAHATRNFVTEFALQYRHDVALPADSGAFFVAIGSIGAIERYHTTAFTFADTDYPAMTRWSIKAPLIPTIGVGVEMRVAKNVALRAEVNGAMGFYWSMAGRAGVGVVYTFGAGRP